MAGSCQCKRTAGCHKRIVVLIDLHPDDGEPEWVQSLADQAAAAAAAASAEAGESLANGTSATSSGHGG